MPRFLLPYRLPTAAVIQGGTAASGCPANDQRGQVRPDQAADNGSCDIGAYESQGIG